MYARSDMPISFPGLFGDWEFNPSPVAIDIGNGIYWYGIIICLGLILAVLFCARRAKRYGLTEDNVYDLIIWEIPLCLLGARAYYVLFYLDLYRDAAGKLDWGKMIAIWDGGMAIYGAVIVAFLTALVVCRAKKISFPAFADLGVIGLLIGQSIGRWGNFMNREAFGGETTLPWRMRLWTSASEFIEVHPTFLYESLWNLAGLLLLLFVIEKGRTFDGENTCFYFLWYGIGRTFIEGLRTDSLYLFDAKLFGQPVRVSQVLSVVLVIAAFAVLVVNKRRHAADGSDLLVNRLAAAAEEETAEAAPTEESSAEEVPAEETADEATTADEAAPAEEAQEEPSAEKDKTEE